MEMYINAMIRLLVKQGYTDEQAEEKVLEAINNVCKY